MPDTMFQPAETFDGKALVGAKLLKLSSSERGGSFVVTLNADHTISESLYFKPEETWGGKWSLTVLGGLIIEVGEYLMLVTLRKDANGAYIADEGGIPFAVYFLQATPPSKTASVVETVGRGAQRSAQSATRAFQGLGRRIEERLR